MTSQALAAPLAGSNCEPAHREIARLLGRPPSAGPQVSGRDLEPPVLDRLARVVCCFEGGRVEVSFADGARRSALRAVSCVVRPQSGDRVRLTVEGDSAWITAILEREPASAVEMDFGDANLKVTAGAIGLHSRSDLELSAHKLSTCAEVSLSACGDRYSNVAGTDSTHANCTLFRTAGHMSLHAGNTSLTAESLIKVDAAQVHMC